MANHKGSEGVVHIGTTAIAELRSWEFNEEGAVIDDTIISDAWDTHQTGTNRWSGRASARSPARSIEPSSGAPGS